jgi:hypothetical protein
VLGRATRRGVRDAIRSARVAHGSGRRGQRPPEHDAADPPHRPTTCGARGRLSSNRARIRGGSTSCRTIERHRSPARAAPRVASGTPPQPRPPRGRRCNQTTSSRRSRRPGRATNRSSPVGRAPPQGENPAGVARIAEHRRAAVTGNRARVRQSVARDPAASPAPGGAALRECEDHRVGRFTRRSGNGRLGALHVVGALEPRLSTTPDPRAPAADARVENARRMPQVAHVSQRRAREATIRARCGRSSVGRASASQAEGRGFEPHRPLHIKTGFMRVSGVSCSLPGYKARRDSAPRGLAIPDPGVLSSSRSSGESGGGGAAAKQAAAHHPGLYTGRCVRTPKLARSRQVPPEGVVADAHSVAVRSAFRCLRPERRAVVDAKGRAGFAAEGSRLASSRGKLGDWPRCQ